MNKLVFRHEKVAFMSTDVSNAGKYARMQGFTDMSKSKEVKEQNRKYVDEKSERNFTTGMSENISYSFDEYTENSVQEEIIEITNREIIGTDAIREIIVVDFSKTEDATKGFPAIRREYSIVPDSEGGDAEVYTFTGAFKSSGEIIEGFAKSEDEFKTITFTENTTPKKVGDK